MSEAGIAHQRLVALEPGDLDVISAHVQDAAVHPRDILWRPAEKRVVVGLKRMDWDLVRQGGCDCRRVIAALRFDRALSCQARGIAEDATPLNLLAVEFEASQAPSGTVHLIFSAGAELRIEVECLECELADLASRDQSEPC